MKRTALVFFFLLAAGGCQAPPIDRAAIEDPGLLHIRDAFEDVVRAAHDHPTYEWHSGWIGNILVNSRGDETLGLCYQWQEWVYQEILETVDSVGWEACGVAVNRDAGHEHYAVVVYDPQRCRRESILPSPETNPSFVLDAWRRGRPDIYTMADWLTLPQRITVAAELETLPDEEIDLPFR